MSTRAVILGWLVHCGRDVIAWSDDELACLRGRILSMGWECQKTDNIAVRFARVETQVIVYYGRQRMAVSESRRL